MRRRNLESRLCASIPSVEIGMYMVVYMTSAPFGILCFFNTHAYIHTHIHTNSDNEDPLVRGLALRSLCGLRLESTLEYVEQPLRKSLTDVSSYVRKTAVMGILKVFSRC